MIRNGFTCRKIMVQSVYILSILSGQYMYVDVYIIIDMFSAWNVRGE